MVARTVESGFTSRYPDGIPGNSSPSRPKIFYEYFFSSYKNELLTITNDVLSSDHSSKVNCFEFGCAERLLFNNANGGLIQLPRYSSHVGAAQISVHGTGLLDARRKKARDPLNSIFAKVKANTGIEPSTRASIYKHLSNRSHVLARHHNIIPSSWVIIVL